MARPRGLSSGAMGVWIAILAVLLVGAGILGYIGYSRLGGTPSVHKDEPVGPVAAILKTLPPPEAQPSPRPAAPSQTGKRPSPAPASSSATSAGVSDPTASTAAAPSASKGGPAKLPTPEPTTPAVMRQSEKNPAGIQVTDPRVFSDSLGMTTYVGCRLKNDTGQMIPSLKVTLAAKDAEGKAMGAATAVIYNVSAGASVPVVTEWHHDEGIRAASWSGCEVEANPAGTPQDLPTLVVSSEPWATADQRTANKGEVKTNVTNKSLVKLDSAEAFALLIGEDGGIVGVARAVVPVELKPNVVTVVALPWDRTPGKLVARAEMWVQVAR
jgi:hypothetical protein